MIGQLSHNEIEELLSTQIVGRIACHDEDFVYVVPISYAYDGNYIYCHGFEGKKLQLMRKKPKVCFQVDEFKDMANWKSVIAWGEFEELKEKKEKLAALRILLSRNLPIISSMTTHLGETWPFSSVSDEELNRIAGVVFRIAIKEKTGKFEKATESATTKFSAYT